MINVALIGASGRMGVEIQSVFEKTEEWAITQSVGKAPGMCQVVNQLKPESVDIVVDFSNIDIFSEVVQWCLNHKKPLVSGTTGLSNEHHELLSSAGMSIPLLWSANMSVGIAWLSKTLRELGSLADDFDFQIEEFHHRYKVDSPSGTAKHLQRELEAVVAKEVPKPLSVRGGGIFGVHKIWAMSDQELIVLEHQALNRSVFANGAVRAALWLKDQGCGLYQLEDTL